MHSGCFVLCALLLAGYRPGGDAASLYATRRLQPAAAGSSPKALLAAVVTVAPDTADESSCNNYISSIMSLFYRRLVVIALLQMTVMTIGKIFNVQLLSKSYAASMLLKWMVAEGRGVSGEKRNSAKI